ncbi:uncharacterized protein YndB with AHSA1/START domain [Yoonia maritima]|uniref:Uncharacterized protein YndB with AHSA1/START domain n=1 Tax=Yoonia maritima TaxID=1435347 RepID=A0A2T0W228_9RHOB|nr:SRPBCC domain-containing protein [Yoonia maritima]PRY79005.1 uncharacterized protein YndB with AHSA1/START domain [Yoonia maritima]
MNDPIHKIVDVPLTPEDAFALFTDGIDSWWPGAAYSESFSDGRTPRNIRIETHKGGKIIETTKSGAECIWGEIIAYNPGRFLSFTWHPGQPAAKATVVAISFKATQTGTQCDLTHGGFDILGPIADAVSTCYLTAWHSVLGCFCSFANACIDA